MALNEASISIAVARVGPVLRRWGRGFGRHVLRMVSEPLVHFVIAGFALFVVVQLYQAHTNTYRITVTTRHVQQLANDYALQFGVRPDAPTLAALVRRDLHDEMLYREGLALKLDRGDQIVRRRVVQKMQFLMQDLHAPPEPTTAQLQVYYQAHAKKYLTPPQVTFSHIFFAANGGDDTAARVRAQAVLHSLSNKMARAPDRGDPFPDLYDFSAYEPEQVYRLFGHTQFASAVYASPTGQWSGPVRSSYGWHLIYVDARKPASQPPLSAVRDVVRADYLQAAQDKENRATFATLAKRFTVVDAAGKPLP